VVDEPEIYLHPDVQRQLLGVIRDIGASAIMATHSSEIMAEAEPSDIVLIDKTKRIGERLRDVASIQRSLDLVGSAQNITLTALARSRRVLFVEGDYDFADGCYLLKGIMISRCSDVLPANWASRSWRQG